MQVILSKHNNCLIMHLTNGLEAYLSLSWSSLMFFFDVITNKPLDGNCSNEFSTSKWSAELIMSCFFKVVEFKVADSAPNFYKTFIGLYLCIGFRYCKPFYINCCQISLIWSLRDNFIFYFVNHTVQKVANDSCHFISI